MIHELVALPGRGPEYSNSPRVSRTSVCSPGSSTAMVVSVSADRVSLARDALAAQPDGGAGGPGIGRVEAGDRSAPPQGTASVWSPRSISTRPSRATAAAHARISGRRECRCRDRARTPPGLRPPPNRDEPRPPPHAHQPRPHRPQPRAPPDPHPTDQDPRDHRDHPNQARHGRRTPRRGADPVPARQLDGSAAGCPNDLEVAGLDAEPNAPPAGRCAGIGSFGKCPPPGTGTRLPRPTAQPGERAGRMRLIARPQPAAGPGAVQARSQRRRHRHPPIREESSPRARTAPPPPETTLP